MFHRKAVLWGCRKVLARPVLGWLGLPGGSDLDLFSFCFSHMHWVTILVLRCVLCV